MKIFLLLSVLSFLTISVINIVFLFQHFHHDRDCLMGKERCLNETEQLLSPTCAECFDRWIKLKIDEMNHEFDKVLKGQGLSKD